MEALMPTRRERQWFHSIALFYFLVGVVIGLPLWWYTTSPEQHALPTEKIGAIASQAITVGIDVAVLNLDPKLPKEDIDSLKQSLYFKAADAQRSLDAQHQVVAAASGRDSETRRYTALPVRVDYRFYVSDASGQVSKDVLAKGVSSDLDHTLVNSDLFVHLGGDKSSAVRHNVESAYYFVILPSGSKGLENESTKLDAVVRAITERNIIYLRSLPTEKMTSIILGILQEQLVKPPTLQAIYSSVWWKGSNTEISMPSTTSNSTLVDYASARAEVAKLRTYQLPAAPGYEITVTLVSPYNVEPSSPPCLPSTDDWMWGPGNVSNLSFGEWLQRYVNPGLGDLKRFLNLNLYSQYLYSVMLDALEWSKLSKDRTHRFYTSAQLSNVLNSLEAYLGQHASERSLSNETNGGLHLVVVVDTPTREYNATKRKPLRFHISGSSRADPPSSIALVPQWGAFISLDDVDISLENLGGVLVNTIRSFVGLSVRSQDIVSVGRGGSEILLESGSVKGVVVKWELDLWLRRRAIESLSTAALTLTSLVSTIERVPTMVINFEVANRVKSAVSAWSEAVSELASPPSASSKNPGARAFIAARIALENADAAFFDHSLLDLLYFPSDQIFGIYVPLFAPIGLPLIASGVAALKFFLRKGAK
ncbi:unnamed protein product [Hymenolepis diminuta]|uniref:GPI transamidase component PIG-S n=2 Tax=Hymenolepis diminuta TaxID=6216 RepID=A0A3P7B813_HYMDI|nr:unnamed protein product [Hymenolepis diminuta]